MEFVEFDRGGWKKRGTGSGGNYFFEKKHKNK